MSGAGPVTVWQCPECLAETTWQTTHAPEGTQIEVGCHCGGQPRIVELDGVQVAPRVQHDYGDAA